MRKRFGQSLRIGVSTQGLALMKTSRWQSAPPELVAEHAFTAGAPGFEAIAAGVRQLLQGAGCAGWSATIVLADDLTRLWQVTPPLQSTRLADLEAAAAVRFQALYGEPVANWQLSAGWDASKPFLAAAMPRHLLTLLQQAAAEQQVTLVEIVPQFVAGWNQWRGALKPGAWYGLVQQGVLTLGAIDAGSVRAVRAVALPDGASLEWLGQHVAREALRLNLEAPVRLQLSGPAPAAWNSSTGGALACSLLAPGRAAGASPAAQLAATGARAHEPAAYRLCRPEPAAHGTPHQQSGVDSGRCRAVAVRGRRPAGHPPACPAAPGCGAAQCRPGPRQRAAGRGRSGARDPRSPTCRPQPSTARCCS